MDKELIVYKYDTSINKPVLGKKLNIPYYMIYPAKIGWIHYSYPTKIGGWVYYRVHWLGKEKDKEIIDISLEEWFKKVFDIIWNELKER